MRLAVFAASALAALMIHAGGAFAASNTVGFEVDFDESPTDFSTQKDISYQGIFSHTFSNGVILGGSFQATQKINDDLANNIEATLGYKKTFGGILALGGSLGVGERLQNAASGGDFPYYVLRATADLILSKKLTWNAVFVRYRNAFDTSFGYETPQIGTGVTVNITPVDAVYVKFYHSWKNGADDNNGIGLGYKRGF